MAPASLVLSYHWGSDIQKLSLAAAGGATVTNHSYGNIPAWDYGHRQGCPVNWFWFGRDQDFDSIHFGRYDEDAAAFDRAAVEKPSLSIFVAAGNERTWQGEPDTLPEHFDGRHCVWSDSQNKWVMGTKPRARHSRKGGFDTLSGHAVAKNVITVGAMADLKSDWGRADIKLTDFSSLGPTDDGRIKPDVIANGEMLYSTAVAEKCEKSPTCDPTTVPEHERHVFVSESGTSMASPVAAGVGALLNELAFKKHRRSLFGDEMRAVLVHSALSRRTDNGPTYDSGWGVIMGVQAANVILGRSASLERWTLRKGEAIDVPLEWRDGRDARVTVVWHDAPGLVVPEDKAAMDDATSMLVDRLAVTLHAPDREHFPWSLNPKVPSAPPTRSRPNQVDNVVRFDVPQGLRRPDRWHLRINAASVKSDQVSVAIAYYGLMPAR